MTPALSAGSVAAVDLGATSGRVILGQFADGHLRLRHLARFANEPVRIGDGLHWNILELYRQLLMGLAAAEREASGEIRSIGIDSWAVDYGLLRGGRLLGVPYHYRDSRNEAGVAAVHAKIHPAELYRRNGVQHLNFNTVFQLASEGELLGFADRLLLIPDLLNHWLTGAEVAERSNASTTGLYDPRSQEWDLGLATRLGIPSSILPPLVNAGSPLGVLQPEAAAAVGRALDVVTVGSHDTASAVVAIPNPGRDFAYISCGTWGLVGLELDAPVISDQARAANFTNEGGVDGRVRFLHNVMGLWLLSESLHSWAPVSTAEQRSSLLQELLQQAAKLEGPVALFEVNDPVFLPPGDIPSRIAEWCRTHGEPVPQNPAQFVRTIVQSLGAAFARAVHDAARLADHEVSVIHLVGGGVHNALLCQATADHSGLPVLAGPVEATAIGNVLIQARSTGLVSGDLAELRSLVASEFPVIRYEPREV
ncbi:rhamnulokinase family protein [Psychromicrobium sp. YIM B11713]|uniref:rhamnulokinase n=1 Tax=Psychromicrobium sp. YIM B11713 TaxID=3145233 RepID=UPI00374FB801